MRVYHFLSPEYGLKDLKEKRLKISESMSLNDPFEFLGVDLSCKETRKKIKKLKQEFSKYFGLICFSENWNSPVQWAHYASKHQGICLGFEIPDKRLKEVKYVDKRPSLSSTMTNDEFRKLFLTKFSHWSYEKEYRMFLELTEQEDGLYYEKFSKEMILKQVIIGVKSNITKKDVLEAFGDEKIEIFRVRSAFKSFSMVRNRATDSII
jgi:hypothetical protein